MFDHCIYFNTTALARTLEREWVVAFQAFGLTPPQGFMLRAVLLDPGVLQSDLAQALSISRSTATRTLDGLERLGFIERRAVAGDGRQTGIHPTTAAHDIEGPLNHASGALTKRLKKVLGDETFSTFVDDVKFVKSKLE